MAEELRELGAEVGVETLELPPQWIPSSWEVTASAGTESFELESAWPAYGTVETGPGGLDLEVVYLGWGTQADMAGRDIAGKAAIIYSMPMSGSIRHSATMNGALARAEANGAAAIFVVIEIPGNLSYSLFPPGTSVPTFALGSRDGEALREKIEESTPGTLPRLYVRLDVDMVPDLTTSSVWGEIPAPKGGAEGDIIVVAHRDAFFEGKSDNATGVATALGLAAHFARIPLEERHRTIKIIGTPGHHDLEGIGQDWLLENTSGALGSVALLINAEHTAHTLIDRWGNDLMPTNAVGVFSWTVNGSPALLEIANCAFDEFGITRWNRMGGPTGEIGSIRTLMPSVGLMHAAVLLHTNSPETIPGAGLVATTRAYARIIDDVNRLDMGGLAGS